MIPFRLPGALLRLFFIPAVAVAQSGRPLTCAPAILPFRAAWLGSNAAP